MHKTYFKPPKGHRKNRKIHQDYNWFDQEEAVKRTRQKIIAFNLILEFDI